MFMLYHFQRSRQLTTTEIVKVFGFGLRMDLAFTGYICAPIFLLVLLNVFFDRFPLRSLATGYTAVLIFLLTFLAVADMELYKYWGFRMDITPLQYLQSPEEMKASSASSPIIMLLLLFLAVAFFNLFIFRKFFAHLFDFVIHRKSRLPAAAMAGLLLALLFIPIRGGIQKIPLNHSDVYFSEKTFANHAALNLPWNLVHSILNRNSTKNPFQYYPAGEAARLTKSLYADLSDTTTTILNAPRPNVIIIIMESLTAKLIGSVGGEPGVTPNLDSIASDGLVFTNVYAAGDRSEKGQTGILSGYPNQAITSIIKTPKKTQELPSLNEVLLKAGYTTQYTYGGELEFANIKSYLLNTGYKNLTGKYDFPESERTTSWGVHDEYLFRKFQSELNEMKQPFFATAFTLSSHEPFDVPMQQKFIGSDDSTLFKNSVFYTDSTIGDFIRKIKKEAWWQNTLVILVADHGHPIPGYDRNDLPRKFHIPLIFTGGALAKKGRIDATGSQTDIATTLLAQLGIKENPFHFSRNLLDTTQNHFAFYSFNDGFGFITDSSAVTFDNAANRVLYHTSPLDTTALKFGKAYMQASYQDFIDR